MIAAAAIAGVALAVGLGLAWISRRHGKASGLLACLAASGAASLLYGLSTLDLRRVESPTVLTHHLIAQDLTEATALLRQWILFRDPACHEAPGHLDTDVVETEPAKEWRGALVAGAWFERDQFTACGASYDLTVVGWVDGHGVIRRRSAAPGSTWLDPRSQDAFLTMIGARRFDDHPSLCQPVVIAVTVPPASDHATQTKSEKRWEERWTFRTCQGEVTTRVQFEQLDGRIRPTLAPMFKEQEDLSRG